MDKELLIDNELVGNVTNIVSDLESHPDFGLNGMFRWPYSIEDSRHLVLHYKRYFSLTGEELVNFIEDETREQIKEGVTILEQGEEYANKCEGDSMSYFKFTSLQSAIIYNKKDVKINSWSGYYIITSAFFCLLLDNLSCYKTAYDKAKAKNPLEIVASVNDPKCFYFPCTWPDIFRLCVSPGLGPVLTLALKKLPSLSKPSIISTIIISSINYHGLNMGIFRLYLGNDLSFFKSGVVNFLSILNIDEQIAFDLAEQAEKLNSLEPLEVFLKNYKLELDKKI